MVNMDELDKFILKFKSLWQSGSNVKLTANVDSGIAHISLHVSVGLDNNHASSRPQSSSKSGRESPCRKRRRERRKAEREAKAAAEEAAAGSAVNVDCSPSEVVVNQAEMSSDAKFEILVEAQDEVTNLDITEAIEENFDGLLDEMKFSKQDALRFICVHKLKVETSALDDGNIRRNFWTYRIIVKNNEVTLNLVDSWKVPGKFDDLAFRNLSGGKPKVKVRDILKII